MGIFITLYINFVGLLTLLGILIGRLLVKLQQLDGPVMVVYCVSLPIALILAVPVTMYIHGQIKLK